mgnify:CR=1 FL=1
MSGNSFGKIFKVTTFGESHGTALGCIIDGCPPQIELNEADIQEELNRRKPGQSDVTTQRKEDDTVQILSGVFEGKTLGTPIGLIIYNNDQRSQDYSNIKDTFRPNHADITYHAKYGHRDYRGGGRSSARETAMRVAAGAVAKKYLESIGVATRGYVSQIGNIKADKINLNSPKTNKYFFADETKLDDLNKMFSELISEGNSVGAKLGVSVKNCPIGLGEPVFDRLHAELGKAMLSINAVKAFEIGSGVSAAKMLGSEHNDQFSALGKTLTNNSGGIQGGISNGEDITLKVTFKPVATIMRDQDTINAKGEESVATGKGRHDPCVVPRAVPIVEAMCLLTIADHYLRQKAIG